MIRDAVEAAGTIETDVPAAGRVVLPPTIFIRDAPGLASQSVAAATGAMRLSYSISADAPAAFTWMTDMRQAA